MREIDHEKNQSKQRVITKGHILMGLMEITYK